MNRKQVSKLAARRSGRMVIEFVNQSTMLVYSRILLGEGWCGEHCGDCDGLHF